MNEWILSHPQWIWLNGHHPQRTYHTVFSDKKGYDFCVAEFQKTFKPQKEVHKARLIITADTTYRFWLNGVFGGTGPAAPGGDYGSTKPTPKIFCTEYPLTLQKGENTLFVQVRLGAEVMTESSWGHGGLFAVCKIGYADGTTETIQTDESWQARRCDGWRSSVSFDGTLPIRQWESAVTTENIWTAALSPIPPLQEAFIPPAEWFIHPEFQNRVLIRDSRIHITKGSPVTFTAKYDRIYSAFSSFSYHGANGVHLELKFQEHLGKTDRSEKITANESMQYRGWKLQSIAYMEVTVSNLMDEDIEIADLGLIFTCYPVETAKSGSFACSEEALNHIYEVGKWTLQICRQTLHLDSPIHQETLGCTGDYFIASLINYFVFGDARLTHFDLTRTADWLRQSGGRMFHTTYSLIWVQMLSDYVCFTADMSVVSECMDAMETLLALFEGYTNEDGLIDRPPNYMFVDWVEADGYNLHHPPKALGQAALNAFYYKALQEAAALGRLVGQGAPEVYTTRAEKVKKAFYAAFWDKEKGLYFDGQNTPDPAGDWKPENPGKRYFSQHTNALAVLYGLTEPAEAAEIMERVLCDKSLIQAQPYFMHYVLEALDKADLFGKYGLPQIRRWTALVEECDRGLKEVWFGFDCDYSHVWGATPTYQLPSKMLGLVMLEPGFRKISLHPQLFGLEWAEISLPTPYGMIRAKLYADRPTEWVISPEITVIFE